MEKYTEISKGLQALLDKAAEMGWSYMVWIEKSQDDRTYVEIGRHSPAGEDFSMIIDFDAEDQCDSFLDNLKSCCEDFDMEEHIEMWIGARRSGVSGVPPAHELVKDARAIDNMLMELSQALGSMKEETEEGLENEE